MSVNVLDEGKGVTGFVCYFEGSKGAQKVMLLVH